MPELYNIGVLPTAFLRLMPAQSLPIIGLLETTSLDLNVAPDVPARKQASPVRPLPAGVQATAAYQLKSALQAQMHDVAVRRHADRSLKCTREVERADTGDAHQPAGLNALNHMAIDAVPDTRAHLLTRPAAAFAGRAVGGDQCQSPVSLRRAKLRDFLKH
jgi:hypothetical protein